MPILNTPLPPADPNSILHFMENAHPDKIVPFGLLKTMDAETFGKRLLDFAPERFPEWVAMRPEGMPLFSEYLVRMSDSGPNAFPFLAIAPFLLGARNSLPDDKPGLSWLESMVDNWDPSTSNETQLLGYRFLSLFGSFQNPDPEKWVNRFLDSAPSNIHQSSWHGGVALIASVLETDSPSFSRIKKFAHERGQWWDLYMMERRENPVSAFQRALSSIPGASEEEIAFSGQFLSGLSPTEKSMWVRHAIQDMTSVHISPEWAASLLNWSRCGLELDNWDALRKSMGPADEMHYWKQLPTLASDAEQEALSDWLGRFVDQAVDAEEEDLAWVIDKLGDVGEWSKDIAAITTHFGKMEDPQWNAHIARMVARISEVVMAKQWRPVLNDIIENAGHLPAVRQGFAIGACFGSEKAQKWFLDHVLNNIPSQLGQEKTVENTLGMSIPMDAFMVAKSMDLDSVEMQALLAKHTMEKNSVLKRGAELEIPEASLEHAGCRL